MKQIEKDFDCLKMKDEIQAKIYAETKDMTFAEYRAYLDERLKNSELHLRMKEKQKQALEKALAEL